MRKIVIALALVFGLSGKTMAIDIVVPASAGGTYHKFASIIADGLKAQGHEVNLIVSGNCVIGKKQWNDRDTAIMINSEATNAVKKCHVPITVEHLAHTIFTTGWTVVSKSGTLGNKMGVVSYMKHTVKDLPVKLVPYKNTTEIKAAFLAGEIDSAFLTTARASEIKNKTVLVDTQSIDKGKFSGWNNNDLTLNYYLLSKKVDRSIIDLIKSNEKLHAIASKKNMTPVSYNDVNKQIEYLTRNENKWRQ